MKNEKSWVNRLKAGLGKTRQGIHESVVGLLGGGHINATLYEELETTLLMADMGREATHYLLSTVQQKISLAGLKDINTLKKVLSDVLLDLIRPLERPLDVTSHAPFVLMCVGVNGVGKTTSIGKLVHYFKRDHKTILLAAGDTFRAAAHEQLGLWAKRHDVRMVGQQGNDSASVCYDAVKMACTQHIDVVLLDTAGRLTTQRHLMEEIKKVKRVVQKALPDAPHEVMLVLDANTGLNALSQVKAFDEALGLTGFMLTKLDGTAKGGIIAAIAKEHPLPLRFIGLGEAADDLQPFIASDYTQALFADDVG